VRARVSACLAAAALLGQPISTPPDRTPTIPFNARAPHQPDAGRVAALQGLDEQG